MRATIRASSQRLEATGLHNGELCRGASPGQLIAGVVLACRKEPRLSKRVAGLTGPGFTREPPAVRPGPPRRTSACVAGSPSSAGNGTKAELGRKCPSAHLPPSAEIDHIQASAM